MCKTAFYLFSFSLFLLLLFNWPYLLQDIDSEGPEPSDWDKYASEEYEILVAEETANEQLHEGYEPVLLLLIFNEM